jgi:hypothetical protein
MRKVPSELSKHLAKLGKAGGKKAAANMTPEQRKARAVAASQAASRKRKENQKTKSKPTNKSGQ